MSYFPTNFILSHRNRFIRGTLIIFGIIFLGLYFWRDLDTTDNQKTLWVIDNSLSMTVTDIGTKSGIMISRLDLAKNIIMQSSKNITWEQAIMTSAQWARLELPMNQDAIALTNVVDGITPLVRWWGSSLMTPIETIRLIYWSTPHLHVIWITDGEFSDTWASFSGFTTNSLITFIGVGTRTWWPILLWYNWDGRPKYKESEWVRVNSSRNDALLTSISKNFNTKLLTYDSDVLNNLTEIDIYSSSWSEWISLIMILWIGLITSWLVFPRYQYHQNLAKWK